MAAVMPEMLSIFGVLVLVPVRAAVVKEKVRFQGPGKPDGRRERAIIYEYVRYPSWEAAVEATGLSKAALRWKLERR